MEKYLKGYQLKLNYLAAGQTELQCMNTERTVPMVILAEA